MNRAAYLFLLVVLVTLAKVRVEAGRRYAAAVVVPDGVELATVAALFAADGFGAVEAHRWNDAPPRIREALAEHASAKPILVTGTRTGPSADVDRVDQILGVVDVHDDNDGETADETIGAIEPTPPPPTNGPPEGSTQWARLVFREAWQRQAPGRRLTRGAEQAILAVARFETTYGRGWTQNDAARASKNWGAIQCTSERGAPCGPGCFETSVTTKAGETYRGCFKVYASDVDGCADLIREMLRRRTTSGESLADALDRGNVDEITRIMEETGYYEASRTTYAAGVWSHGVAIARRLGEPLVLRRNVAGAGAVLGTIAALLTVGAAAAYWTEST